MNNQSSKKKGIIIASISAIILVAVLGVTFAIWNYSRTTDNQILVTGDIYMKFKETPALTIENAMPSEGPGANDYFEFTIEGKNTYSKPIWYEIDIQHGEPHETRGTRIEDNLLAFKLVEVKDENQEEVLIEKGSYTGLAAGKGIYVNTIPAGTNSKITRTYRLYMWISSKTIIGNTSDANYDMDEWNDVFASIKVNVTGDFNEKSIKSEIGTDVVKDTIGQPGGVIGVKADNTPTTSKDDEVREYRYSGNDGIKNYIYFNCSEGTTYETASSNCEKWRIIGVFKDESGKEHLKIVRNERLSGIFPETYEVEGTTYNIKSMDTTAYWNNKVSGTDNNDWATAGLQYWLNTKEDETEGEANKGYLSYLKGDTLSMIEETKYYLGTVTSLTSSSMVLDTPKEAYANERAVSECADGNGPSTNTGSDLTFSETPNCRVWAGNKAIWEGKVALMYPSDYGFSTESSNWETQLKDFSTIKSSSWMNSMPSNGGCLLSPSSTSSIYVANLNTTGSVHRSNVGGNLGVRPSVNLISEIKITQGEGTETTPYYPEMA